MNQRRQGGQGRQMQRETPPEQQSQNQRVTVEMRTDDILQAVVRQKEMIENFLPDSIPWDRFYGALFMALKHNPGILRCTIPSIIQGALRAAYDGVSLDGREAALIPSDNRYQENGQWITKTEARYNIMVAGVRKQIMRGGQVDLVETVLVYEKEPFRAYLQGGVRLVDHEQIVDADKRGALHAVYSMATLKNGRVSFEVMTKADVMAVKAVSPASGSAKSPWSTFEGEMWRKTVLRRHRKSLPGASERPDAEELDLYPQMAQEQSIPGLPAPRRPQRQDYRALPNAQGTESGTPLSGFGWADRQIDRAFEEEGRREEQQAEARQQAREVDQNERRQQESRPDERNAAENRTSGADQKTDNAGEKSTGKPKPSEQAKAAPPPIPANAQEWRDFEDGVIADIRSAPSSKELRLFWGEIEHIIEAADPSIANRLNDAMSDRLSDLASAPPADDEAGASQGSSTSGGEE